MLFEKSIFATDSSAGHLLAARSTAEAPLLLLCCQQSPRVRCLGFWLDQRHDPQTPGLSFGLRGGVAERPADLARYISCAHHVQVL